MMLLLRNLAYHEPAYFGLYDQEVAAIETHAYGDKSNITIFEARGRLTQKQQKMSASCSSRSQRSRLCCSGVEVVQRSIIQDAEKNKVVS